MITDYVAAAIAAAEASETPSSEPAAEEVQPSTPEPASTGTAETDSSDNSPPVEKKPDSLEAPAKVDRVAKGFEDLAREKAMFRAEREKFKAEQAEAQEFANLRIAAKKKSAMALLAAAGIPWSQAAQEVLEGTGGGAPEKKESTPEEDPREARIAALEREIATAKAAAGRADVMTKLNTKVREMADKFPLVESAGEAAKALDYIEQYFAQHNELPGETADETMEIALEVVETRLKKEAERWEKVLTKWRGGASVSTVKPATPPAPSQVAQNRTLTNTASAGPSNTQKARPKTADEYRLAALQAMADS